MANTVKLTFAGDDKQLATTFDHVGETADRATDKVGETADGFDKAGESAEESQKKAQGFADVLGGTTDVASGFGAVMKGDVVGGLATVGQGLAGVADGAANFLIPALGKAKTAIMGMNLAFLSSPITWIVAGILLVVAAIVLIATKTDWFQKAWKASWSWIKTAAADTWNFIKQIPGWIETAFKRIAGVISAPFRAEFNLIAKAWNNTVGRLSWTVPGWVPFLGGDTLSVPKIPTFHSGGTVPGPVGSPQLALLQGGETVRSAAGGDGDSIRVVVQLDSQVLAEGVARVVERRGGSPSVLNIRVA